LPVTGPPAPIADPAGCWRSACPDLLGRLFDPDQPDVAWCSDVTYIPSGEGWLYLASVIDLASRQLLGYSMGTHHDAALVTGALEAAVATRGQTQMDGTIFHSDRGAEGEYTSAACIAACARLGLRRSMSRTGSCLDNAIVESCSPPSRSSSSTALITAPAPSPRRDLRLDRLVQLLPAALHPWLRATHRVGTAPRHHQPATIDHGRMTPVSTSRGRSTAPSGRMTARPAALTMPLWRPG
jgi:Integrase core domain